MLVNWELERRYSVKIRPDESKTQKYRFDVSHRWSLPGVKCDACGWTGPTSGAVYPSIVLPAHIDPRPYQSYWPVTPERIHELMTPITRLIPPGLTVGAGT